MTREEMRKKFAGLQNIKPVPKETEQDGNEKIENDWTEEEMMEAAKRIMKRLGITAEIYKG